MAMETIRLAAGTKVLKKGCAIQFEQIPGSGHWTSGMLVNKVNGRTVTVSRTRLKLETLDVTGCRNVTKGGLLAVGLGLPTLSRLRVPHGPNFADVVQLVHQQNLNVRIELPMVY
tara:strand:- start:2649 stop:2993 length:345 start_codon:yes stop_codon:yes gene_type:complete